MLWSPRATRSLCASRSTSACVCPCGGSKRHAEHALPEVDRRLPARTDQRDVVDALGLDLPHRPSSLASPSLRRKSSRRRRLPRAEPHVPAAPCVVLDVMATTVLDSPIGPL